METRRLDKSFHILVRWQRTTEVKPALVNGDCSQLAGLASAHEASTFNLTVRLSKSHPCYDVSNLVHFEPPVGHLPSSSCVRRKGINAEEARAKCFYGSLKPGVAPLGVPMRWLH